jgi:hypothetical protein
MMVNELATYIFFGPDVCENVCSARPECDGIIAAHARRSVRNF